MTNYPAQIDNTVTLPLVVDNSTPVYGDTVNRLRNAIVAVESELGIQPSGPYTTVRARLDALDAAINALKINGVDGDVEGGLATTKVVGFGGRPFSDQQPEVSQVITWNGIAWIPQDLENITVNILPSSLSLPVDVVFLAGDVSTSSSSPTRVGARIISMDPFPSTFIDGRIRSMKFVADLEVSNAATDGYVQLKDLTNNVIITDTTLTTNSLTSTELSVDIFSGDSDGYMRIDLDAMYEVQIYLLNGGIDDTVICRNARIEIKYSPPLLVTNTIPIIFPADIQFIAGTELSGSTTPEATGRRKLDMDFYPDSLVDGRVRTVKFYADAEVSTVGTTGYVELFDVTHNVLVTNAQFTFTDTVATEISSTLTVGVASGNIRDDNETSYEVRIYKTGGSVADRVICNNARVVIIYT